MAIVKKDGGGPKAVPAKAAVSLEDAVNGAPGAEVAAADSNKALSEFSKRKDEKAAAAAAAAKPAKIRADGLSDLPALPRARKSKPPQDCACGCGLKTKGGSFIPGHDGRPKGWALRVERGIVKLADIPEGERKVVAALLKVRKAEAAKTADGEGEAAAGEQGR